MERVFVFKQKRSYPMKAEEYKQFLDTILKKQAESPDGLQKHMQEVARLAVMYAEEVGYDKEAANLAGKSRDLIRLASPEETLEWATSTGFVISDLMKQIPMLAHGPAAAGWLMKNLPSIGVDVILAVRDHTFPADDAPMLTKILAVADTLEPSRQIPEREEVRLMDIPFEQRFIEVQRLKKLPRKKK